MPVRNNFECGPSIAFRGTYVAGRRVQIGIARLIINSGLPMTVQAGRYRLIFEQTSNPPIIFDRLIVATASLGRVFQRIGPRTQISGLSGAISVASFTSGTIWPTNSFARAWSCRFMKAR